MAARTKDEDILPSKETVEELLVNSHVDSSQNQSLEGNKDENVSGAQPSGQTETKYEFKRGYRFWMIMLTIAFCALLSSLESTVVVTSLPTIIADIGMGGEYIWVTNVYFLTSACLQPFLGQLCNVFGRQRVTIFIFGAYTLGSGICGGANGSAMLITGRAVQGIGSGGLGVIGDVIISDLVPLRYRGNYIAILLLVATVGFSIGPFIGGIIVEKTTWRWVFYLNLPIGGAGMITSYLFLNLKWDRDESFMAKLKRIDYIGNAIVVPSSISVLIALTWAGPVYPWSDFHILVPLLVGAAGLVGFVVFEGSGIPKEPVMPIRLFPNRTSRIVYFNTFLNCVILMWCLFFIPLYFQGVLLSTPSKSGLQLLPMALIAIPGAAVSAIILSKYGKYKALHVAGFLLMSGGGGFLGLLKENSPDAAWVLVQFVPALGSGMLLNTLLPAFQASTQEIDQAVATATWSFIRSFGFVWGIAIAGAIFNAYVNRFAHLIDDEAVRQHLTSGDAYSSATRSFVIQYPQPVRDQIRHVFMLALRRVYLICLAFGGVAAVLAMFEKDVPLRQELDTQYGMEEKEKEKDSEKA